MNDGCGHQGGPFSSWRTGVLSRLSSFGGLCAMLCWQDAPVGPKGGEESLTRDLGDVKLLLTQQPPNELSVNESEADGLDCSGNTPEV